MDILRELVKQLKKESSLCFQDGIGLCQYNTRRKTKGFLLLTYCRTVTLAKPVDNKLRKPYNWWKAHNLVPVDLSKLSTARTESQLNKISDLYVNGSRLYETLV